MTKAQLLAVGSTAELEPAVGCDACKRLQMWARSSWARGHQLGMAVNRRIAREATEALRLEREAHAETNARLTEALLAAEEEASKWRSLAESNATLVEISQRRVERESRLGIEGSNAELCGGPSGPSERAPGYASAPKMEE